MRIQNTKIYMGYQQPVSAVKAVSKFVKKNSEHDPIAAKKESARKMALKLVGDAFSNERKTDDDIKSRREKINGLPNSIGDAQKPISVIEKSMVELRDIYGVTEDSPEEAYEAGKDIYDEERIISGIKKEKAEAEKEKRQETEEKARAARENERLTEEMLEKVSDADAAVNDVKVAQQEVRELLSKMKLIEDDIKGSVVDKNL